MNWARFLFMGAPFTDLAFIFEGEYSFKRHFLLTKRAIFIKGSKKNTEGEEEIETSED